MSTDDTGSSERAEHSGSPVSSRPDGPATSSKLRQLGSLLTAPFRWDGWLKIGGVATALTAVAALWFSAQSLRSTRDQYGLSEQGQVTDRFSRAVENLGSDKINVRLGGIYSLERLARDSATDQPTIIEILSAFVRTQAPADGPQCVMPEFVRSTDNPYVDWKFSGPLPKMQVDVQAAVTVLGRRDPHRDAGSLPDLSNSCLVSMQVKGFFEGADFENSKLAWAFFDHADLRCAVFSRADLSIAIFNNDNLNGAWLFSVQAKNAQFAKADMRGAYLPYAELESANLAGANLSGAELANAILTGAHLHGGKTLGGPLDTDANLSGAHYTEETEWPAGYSPPASTDIGIDKFPLGAECLRRTGP
jgi:hypothetical protein